MVDILIYVVIGIVAGTLSGLFGIGGGIVIIPLLMYMKGFSQLQAQGTSLVAMLPPVGILAFMEYYKKGNTNITAGIIICITMLVAAKFGGQLANVLPVSVMKKAFGIFIILVGIKTFFGKWLIESIIKGLEIEEFEMIISLRKIGLIIIFFHVLTGSRNTACYQY